MGVKEDFINVSQTIIYQGHTPAFVLRWPPGTLEEEPAELHCSGLHVGGGNTQLAFTVINTRQFSRGIGTSSCQRAAPARPPPLPAIVPPRRCPASATCPAHAKSQIKAFGRRQRRRGRKQEVELGSQDCFAEALTSACGPFLL